MVAWFSSEISIVVSFELINLISSFFILAGASQSLSAQTIFPAIFHPKVIIFQCHDNVYNMIITLYYRINGEDVYLTSIYQLKIVKMVQLGMYL